MPPGLKLPATQRWSRRRRAGYACVHTLAQGNGLKLLTASVVLVCVAGLATLWIGYRLLKIPMGLLLSILAQFLLLLVRSTWLKTSIRRPVKNGRRRNTMRADRQ